MIPKQYKNSTLEFPLTFSQVDELRDKWCHCPTPEPRQMDIEGIVFKCTVCGGLMQSPPRKRRNKK